MLAVSLLLVLFASCEGPQNRGTLRINLANESRLIVPEGYSLDTASYRILGTGPSGATLDLKTSKTMVTVEGLVVGEWNLEARALNEDGDELIRGETSVRLTGRTTSATILLDELIGTGNITLNLSWNVDVLSEDPEIEVVLEPAYGTDEIPQLSRTAIDHLAGTATYSGSDYPSGSYRVSARIYEKKVLLAGFTEAVRVANGQTSGGNIEFDLDKYPTEPATIELIDMTGVPVQLSMSGINDTVTADVPITVSLLSDSDDIDSYQITWHLNGEQIGTGESIEFTPTLGVHRLDAVAATSRTGATGSTSFNFEAVSASETGSPNQGNIVGENSGINMGSGMVVTFLPDGNVMIASNEDRTLQICSIVRSSLSLQKTYSYTEIGIQEGQTIADIAAGEKTTTDYKLFMVLNAPLYAAVYNYSPSTMVMSRAAGGMTDDNIQILAESYIPAKAHFAGINIENDVGIAVISDSSGLHTNAFLFPLNASSTAAFEDTVKKNLGNALKEAPVEYFVYDENMFLTGYGDTITGQMTKLQTSETGYDMQLSLAFMKSDISNSTGIAILGDEYLLITGDNALIAHYGEVWMTHSNAPLDFDVSAVISSPDRRYVYMLDAGSSELVSYKIINNGERIEEIAATPVKGTGLNQIRISQSGHTLLLYDDRACDAITVMSVNR